MKVMIAILEQGYVKTELMKWILSQIGNADYEIHLLTSNKRPIDNNRNYIVREFMKTDCEWLIQFDDDMIPIHNILELTKMDKKIIAPYFQTYKDGNIIPLAMKKEKHGWKPDFNLNEGLNKVDAVGTGCLLVHRDVFQKLDHPYFKYKYNKEGRLIKGLDFYFCERAKAKGFDTYVHKDYVCRQDVNVIV
jgi:GT2 family glycosyltransferase